LAVEEKNKKLHWVELGREIFLGKLPINSENSEAFKK